MNHQELYQAAEKHYREHGDTIEFSESNGANASYETVRGDSTVYAYGWLKDWMDAEDAVMETYVRLLEQGEGHAMRDYSDFGGQFKIILDNVMRDINRHDKVVEQVITEDFEVPGAGGSTIVELAEGIEADPELAMTVQERVDFIMESSNEMSRKAKGIVRMSFIYGYTPQEIAKLIRLPVKRVYNTLNYFRNKLENYDG